MQPHCLKQPFIIPRLTSASGTLRTLGSHVGHPGIRAAIQISGTVDFVFADSVL